MPDWLNFNKEISERLDERLAEVHPNPKQFAKPLALVHKQLESWSPAVMGMTREGMLATVTAMVKRGTWLLVLADASKVLCIHMLPKTATNPEWEKSLEFCVEQAAGVVGRPLNQHDLVGTMQISIRNHGGKPNYKTKAVDPEILGRIVGVLFSQHAPDERKKVAQFVDMCVKDSICPLHVGMIGKGSKVGISLIWPVCLPFAPYHEYIEDRLEGRA